MRVATQSLFPMAVLAMMAALTFWLDHATRSEETKSGKYRHDPDFMLNGYTVKKLGEDGKLRHQLIGDTMTHYPDDDSTDVQNPRMTYFGGPLPLHLRSRSADVSKDGKIVTLKDDVHGWRDARGDSPDMTLSTSRLTVYPDQDIAHTDAPVTITRGKSVVNGVGMDLDNKLHILSLRSQVRGVVQPRK
ncbi:MAG: LPS export ABC transporter periplasmic protein LptC [Rhodocyclaceae bacterium]|nr:LPS export ABC transporter periplasmic protein LptC [Rhodocyclaceae bacterium]